MRLEFCTHRGEFLHASPHEVHSHWGGGAVCKEVNCSVVEDSAFRLSVFSQYRTERGRQEVHYGDYVRLLNSERQLLLHCRWEDGFLLRTSAGAAGGPAGGVGEHQREGTSVEGAADGEEGPLCSGGIYAGKRGRTWQGEEHTTAVFFGGDGGGEDEGASQQSIGGGLRAEGEAGGKVEDSRSSNSLWCLEHPSRTIGGPIRCPSPSPPAAQYHFALCVLLTCPALPCLLWLAGERVCACAT